MKKVTITSLETGRDFIVTKEVVDYYNSRDLPVIGMSREFLHYIMGLAKSAHGMSRREYARFEDEIIEDAINIYHANRNRNKRQYTGRYSPRGERRGNYKSIVGRVAEELPARRIDM
jgi:hypothetical protein